MDWGDQETLNSDFLDAMRNQSKKLQEFACSGDGHTAKSMIDRIMFCVVERQADGPGCLFVSDPGNDDPMGSALRTKQDPPKPNEQERLVQVENFLRGTNISPEIRWGVLYELFLQNLHPVVGHGHGRTHQNSSDQFVQRELKTVGGVARQSAG